MQHGKIRVILRLLPAFHRVAARRWAMQEIEERVEAESILTQPRITPMKIPFSIVMVYYLLLFYSLKLSLLGYFLLIDLPHNGG